MPITTSEVHVDQALTNISLAYAQEQTAFIADKIFGRVSVDKLSNKFHVFSKSDYLRGVAEMRAPGSPTAGANFTLSQQTYSCDQFGVHMDVDDLVQANSDAGVNILTSAATYVTEKLLQKRDQEFAAAAFTTGTWTGSSTGTDIGVGTGIATAWSASGGTPIKDIQTQQDAVYSKTGRKPNVLVLGRDVYTALRDSEDVLDRVKFSQRGIVTTDLLAALFDVDEVLIAGSIVNTANEGATASFSYVFDPDDALLVYRPPNPGLMTPAGGYMFEFEPIRALRYRMDQNHSERIEAVSTFDFKVTGADLGVFFNECVG